MSNITDKNLWELDYDRKTIELKANGYINRIWLGASLFQRHGSNMEPCVFMSADVFHVLTSQSDITVSNHHGYRTIFGYTVVLISGTEQLYIGFDLLGKENTL